MKMLEDIISSITGNTKTRIHDPLIGAFLISWITCNWNHLAILIWGEGKLSDRVNIFHLFLSESRFFELNTLFFIPALLTTFYLFALPWISLLSKSSLEFVNSKLHNQAVHAELNQINSQKQLDEVKLLSNPNKPFLEESVKLSLKRRFEIIENIKERRIRLAAKAAAAKSSSEEAAARAAEMASKAKITQLEEANKTRQIDLELSRFQVESTRLRALQESHRFPSAYLYMSILESAMKLDKIYLSLTTSAEIVAAIFNYENFEELIRDQSFNNEDLSKVEYLLCDQKNFALKLQDIIAEEPTKNDALTSDAIFEYTKRMLDKLSIEFVTIESMAEKCVDFFETNKDELLANDELSSEISISNTVYEEIELEDIEFITHSKGITSLINAMARGTHYKHEGGQGQNLRISAEVKSEAVVGKNALGVLSFGSIAGKLVDSYAEEY